MWEVGAGEGRRREAACGRRDVGSGRRELGILVGEEGDGVLSFCLEKSLGVEAELECKRLALGEQSQQSKAS